MTEPISDEELARRFHESYERMAPKLGYTTRPDSAVEWNDVPTVNRVLMVNTVHEVVRPLLDLERKWWAIVRESDRKLAAAEAECERLRAELDSCQLRYIEATNPGIDMEDVKRVRALAAPPDPKEPSE